MIDNWKENKLHKIDITGKFKQDCKPAITTDSVVHRHHNQKKKFLPRLTIHALPSRALFKNLISVLVSSQCHAANLFFTQHVHQEISHAFPWLGSGATGLFGLSDQLLHGAGEEIPSPVPCWAFAGLRPHVIVAESHKLLHMGRDHLQPRLEGHRYFAAFSGT
jgi:hypothetical protein